LPAILPVLQALLKLATDAAGCEVEPPEGETEIPECDKRIYGIKPSSLLSLLGTIVDVISASLMPIIGAIVDTTSYRRLLGRILVTFFCAFIFITIFISENTWFPIAILQMVWGFTVWFQNMITYSYLPDLTDEEAIMNEYTRAFAALSYTAMIVYMGGITGATAAMGYMNEEENRSTLDDEIKTARLAQSVSFTICVIGLSIAWGLLFKKRPAIRILQEGQSIWTSGFRQVVRTVVQIYKIHIPLKWFYISIMFCDPAMMALTILAITFLTDQLQFKAQENGTAMLIMMLLAVPGSYVGSWMTERSDAVISSMVAVVLLIANTVAVAIVLKGPGQQMETYILAGGWGLGTGWKWMCDRMVLLTVLPPGQNAELMGVYVFFRQVIAWLPMLVFTVLNERDISQRIGIATLNVYFILAFLALCRVLVSRKHAVVGEAQQVPDSKEGSNMDDREENPGHGSPCGFESIPL
jgi:MFS-type transporter involved in bile tolerance (Atg22 family)